MRLAKLCAALYAKAKVKAEQTAKTWPDHAHRVARVDFQQIGMPMACLAAQQVMPMPAARCASFAPGNDLAVALKLMLQETVTVAPSK